MKGGTPPACAACKLQRRKCSPQCLLAPYFPGSQPREFENVHRLFGVSKVTKTLSNLDDESERDDAIKSIKYAANMRRLDPVHGCVGVILSLMEQCRLLEEELEQVRKQIEAVKQDISNLDHLAQGSRQQMVGEGLSLHQREGQELSRIMVGSSHQTQQMPRGHFSLINLSSAEVKDILSRELQQYSTQELHRVQGTSQEKEQAVFVLNQQSQEMRPAMFGSNQASSSNAITTAYMRPNNSFISNETELYDSIFDEDESWMDSISDEDESWMDRPEMLNNFKN